MLEKYFVYLVSDNRDQDVLYQSSTEYTDKSRQSGTELLFSVHPYSYAIHAKGFQILVGICCALNCFFASKSEWNNPSASEKNLRISFEKGNATIYPHLSLGVLHAGCRVPNVQSFASVPPNEFVIILSDSISWDGLWLSFGNQDTQSPYRLSIESSPDMISWSSIERPPWFLPESFGIIPSIASRDFLLDLRAPWHWIIASFACPACLALGSFMSVVFGFFGSGRRAAVVLACSYFVTALMYGATACNISLSVNHADWSTHSSLAVVAWA